MSQPVRGAASRPDGQSSSSSSSSYRGTRATRSRSPAARLRGGLRDRGASPGAPHRRRAGQRARQGLLPARRVRSGRRGARRTEHSDELMVVRPSPHGDFQYLVVTRRRTGKERVHECVRGAARAGDVLRLDGRYWLVASIEAGQDAPARAVAVPARYRLRLRHPDGREELGGLRRFRPTLPGSAIASRLSKTGSPSLGRSSISSWSRTSRASRTSASSPSATSRRSRRSQPPARAHARPQPREQFPRPPRPRSRGGADWSVDRARRTRAPARSLIGRQPSASSRCSCSRRSRTTCSSFAGSTRKRIPGARGSRPSRAAALGPRAVPGRRRRARRGSDRAVELSRRAGSSRRIGSPDDEADPLSGPAGRVVWSTREC